MGPDEEALNEETFREEPMIEAAMIECNASAVVVEGPGCDAKFLSEWIAAAVKLQAAWDVAAGESIGTTAFRVRCLNHSTAALVTVTLRALR